MNKADARKTLGDSKLRAVICNADPSLFVRLVHAAEMTTAEVKNWLTANNQELAEDDEIWEISAKHDRVET